MVFLSGIEWEKIEQKPEKEYKVPGEYLLEQRSSIESKDQQIAEQTLTIKHLKEQLEASKAEAESRGNKVKEMIEKFGEMNVKFEDLSSKTEELTQENEALKKLIEEMKAEKQTIEDQLNTLKANNELQEDLVKEKDEDLIKLKEENEQLKQKVTELEEKVNSLPKKDEIEELEKKLESYPSLEEIEELKKRPDPDQVDNLLISKDEEIDNLSRTIEKLKTDLAPLAEENENLKKDCTVLENANANLINEINSLKSELEKLKGIAKQPVQKPIPTPTPKIKKTPSYTPPKTINDIKPPVSYTSPKHTVDIKGPKFSMTEEPQKAKFSYSHNASSEGAVIKKRKLPEQVVNIFENIKMAIQGGIRAGELHKLLEESRDEIANIMGFSSALKAMGDVARKLKKAPPQAQIDDESVKVFLSKIEEWRHIMEGG